MFRRILCFICFAFTFIRPSCEAFTANYKIQGVSTFNKNDSNGNCKIIKHFSNLPKNKISNTKLYQKWGPKWNPRPDSEYYRGDNDNEDIFGGMISYGGRRRRSKFVARFHSDGIVSLQRILVIVNIAFFVQQIVSAVQYLPSLNIALAQSNYPYGALHPLDIVENFILGSAPIMIESRSASFPFLDGLPIPSSIKSRAYGQALTVATTLGPFTMDLVNQKLLTRLQPHRYLTSGFLHGSLLHLFLNMRILWNLPRWLEDNGGTGNGLGGWFLYSTTYLSSIVMGNVMRDYVSASTVGASQLVLGASGGICGLIGLLFAMLRKMGNGRESINVLKSMGILILFGSLVDGVSNASHIGGFLWGAFMGTCFGPTYQKGYSSWRLSRDENEPSLEYRMAMGKGVSPEKGKFPIKYALLTFLFTFVLKPEWRTIPKCIAIAFTRPGLLSGLA